MQLADGTLSQETEAVQDQQRSSSVAGSELNDSSTQFRVFPDPSSTEKKRGSVVLYDEYSGVQNKWLGVGLFAAVAIKSPNKIMVCRLYCQ